MVKIIGVKFRNVGKVYYFDPRELRVRYNDHVIVETARGIEYGTVVLSPTEIPEEKIVQPLKPIMRLATEQDDERDMENRQKEAEAYKICKLKIAERELDMKLIQAEYTFDNSKVLFYFTADGRIDFRELVKDLAGIFRTRIELRQIGVRDETKLLGGMGICGRPMCCHTWLTEFAPVSIKMAKEQNLSLNPTKISGTCGRLMCCLKNESDTYAELNKGMPSKGDYVTTPEGQHGDVQSINILKQTVKVIVEMENDEKELKEFKVRDITFIPKSQKPKCPMREEAQFAGNEQKPREERRRSKALEETGNIEDLFEEAFAGNPESKRKNGEGQSNGRGRNRQSDNQSERGGREPRGEKRRNNDRRAEASESDKSSDQHAGGRSQGGSRQERKNNRQNDSQNDRQSGRQNAAKQNRQNAKQNRQTENQSDKGSRGERKNAEAEVRTAENGQAQANNNYNRRRRRPHPKKKAQDGETGQS